MNFRPMAPGDLDAVMAAERLLHPFPWTRGNFVDSLAAGHGMWVASEATDMAGYAVATQVLDEAHLLNVSVLPDFQRAGRGGAILQYVFDVLRTAGTGRLFLEVRTGNVAARGLYARHEFIEIGRRKGYYPAPGGREDAIVMAREL